MHQTISIAPKLNDVGFYDQFCQKYLKKNQKNYSCNGTLFKQMQVIIQKTNNSNQNIIQTIYSNTQKRIQKSQAKVIVEKIGVPQEIQIKEMIKNPIKENIYGLFKVKELQVREGEQHQLITIFNQNKIQEIQNLDNPIKEHSLPDHKSQRKVKLKQNYKYNQNKQKQKNLERNIIRTYSKSAKRIKIPHTIKHKQQKYNIKSNQGNIEKYDHNQKDQLSKNTSFIKKQLKQIISHNEDKKHLLYRSQQSFLYHFHIFNF